MAHIIWVRSVTCLWFRGACLTLSTISYNVHGWFFIWPNGAWPNPLNTPLVQFDLSRPTIAFHFSLDKNSNYRWTASKLNWKLTFFLTPPGLQSSFNLFVVRAKAIFYKLARASVCIELNWIELNWIELNWIELNWIELNWIQLNWIELNWIQLNWIELNWIELNWIE